MTSETPVILQPNGKPAPIAVSGLCPRCGKSAKDRPRVPSAGFGEPFPVCPCGHEFVGEPWLN